MHFLENRIRIQTKIGNVYTRFQTETRKNHTLHTYKANVRQYPHPPPARGAGSNTAVPRSMNL